MDKSILMLLLLVGCDFSEERSARNARDCTWAQANLRAHIACDKSASCALDTGDFRYLETIKKNIARYCPNE